ncbi:MAG: DNA mismatch repair protein MutS, partial [Bacteroidota bacterium]
TRRLDLVRDGLAERMPQWLSVWYDLEALGSLATYAALHPWTVQPEFASGDEPAFRAESVGHPLLPASESVRNTFELEHVGDAALITGSNMSGKSTFLRALGLNLCLAQAGSYVDAHVLRTRPVRVFTSLNVSDSVTDGLSFFYAEVRRLRALLDQLDASRPTPLFYLIDEIFRGTNNIERLVGSQSILEALVGAPGFGCVTTHDLDLVRLADTLPQLENYHFREHIEAGTMTFDYTLRTGPSPTTNALEIMRIEGLPVRSASKENAGNR